MRKHWTSFSKHYLTCLIKYLLTNLERPTSEKISAGFMNAWKSVFLKPKSVRSCALILKPNFAHWWERAHLCVRARVCVCVCVCVCARIAAALRHAQYREQRRIVNA